MSAKEQEPVPQPETTTASEPKNDKLSLTEQIKNLANQKIESGFEVKDKKSSLELRKVIMDELKINPNSRTMVRDTLKEVFIEKGFQISDLGYRESKIGEMSVSVVKKEHKVEPESQITSNASPRGTLPQSTSIPQSPHGTLPQESESSEIPPEKQYMTESAQKKLISHGLTKVVFPIYTALGIVELDESEIKEESKIPKGQQVKKDFEELAGDIDEYLRENDIKLPALLNHLSIIISIFVVLVLPVIKFKFFSSKQTPEPEFDESADKIEVKA